MHKLWAVIRREFVERVRTKAFVIGTVLGPVLIGLLFALPILLEMRETAAKRVVVLNAAGESFGQRVTEVLVQARQGSGANAKSRYEVVRVDLRAGTGLEQARDSIIASMGLKKAAADAPAAPDGLLVLTDEGLQSGRIPYLGTNVGSPSDMGVLERTVAQAVRTERLVRLGVDPVLVLEASGSVDLQTSKVSDGRLTGESGSATFLLAYVMSFLLYFALLLYGIQVMSSVVEEKTTRIMEVLVSSLTPFQLLLGKVIGVGAVGLFQISIWVGTATLLSTFRVEIAGLFGAGPEAVSAIPLPTMGADLMVVFLVFFVLGFLLYAAAYAAVAAMCNTMQEAQQSNTPITLLIVVGLFTMFALLNEPSGTMARVLGLVPFFAPFVTPVRYSISPVGLPDLLLSMAVTALGVLAIVWVASRIYRVGILMYGKRPSLVEVWRWIRTT